MKRVLLASVAMVMAWSGAAQAAPQQACDEYEEITEFLSEQFGERTHVIGLTKKGDLMEIWASSETGTWTLLLTKASGVACVIGAGEHFDIIQRLAGSKA